MGFPSPSAKAAFVICFTFFSFVLKSTSFERKAMKYFESGLYQSFLLHVKSVVSVDILYFRAKPFFIP